MTISDSNPNSVIKTFHQNSYNRFYTVLTINKSDENETQDNAFIHRLEQLSHDINTQEDTCNIGQWFITTCIARYPHITPSIPRELFWYFGGECLHYVDDKEIRCFQAIEEDTFELATQQEVTLEQYTDIRKKHGGSV